MIRKALLLFVLLAVQAGSPAACGSKFQVCRSAHAMSFTRALFPTSILIVDRAAHGEASTIEEVLEAAGHAVRIVDADAELVSELSSGEYSILLAEADVVDRMRDQVLAVRAETLVVAVVDDEAGGSSVSDQPMIPRHGKAEDLVLVIDELVSQLR